jgi:hypothetical protein
VKAAVTRTEIVKAAATRSRHLAATLDAEYSKQMTRSSKTAAALDDRKKKTAAADDRDGEIAVAALDELRRRPKRRPGEIDEQERFVQDEEQKPIVEVEGIPGKEREEP